MEPNLLKIISDEIESRLNILNDVRMKKFILYGSYARGDFNEESDIDYLILTDLKDEEIKRYYESINNITVDISLIYEKIVSIIILNEESFYKYVSFLPFYNNVISEGKILYG